MSKPLTQADFCVTCIELTDENKKYYQGCDRCSRKGDFEHSHKTTKRTDRKPQEKTCTDPYCLDCDCCSTADCAHCLKTFDDCNIIYTDDKPFCEDCDNILVRAIKDNIKKGEQHEETKGSL